MISSEILKSVSEYAKGMTEQVAIVLNTGEHHKRSELVTFLQSIADTSDKIKFFERDLLDRARSPITFILEKGEIETGIVFSGIPSGHEFNSLILAILQSGGVDIKLDATITELIASIKEPLNFEIFVSLSCHNCPDVVQAINKFSLLNESISSEMIDGGLFQGLIEERNIQGVPSVYLNGELFANGRIELNGLVEKLREITGLKSYENEKMLPLQDVVILGGGPAGISASIYAARKGLKVTVIAEKLGGQVKDTLGIENFISVSATTGPKLTQAMQCHMEDYAILLRENISAQKICSGLIKKVYLSSGEIIQSRSIIIATGANWKQLNIPGERENMGTGVAYCPHCEGPFYRNLDVAVVGGGNSGIEAALDLSGIVNSVTVLEFLPNLKADQVLVDQAMSRDNITVKTNVEIKSILSTEGKVSGIQYIDRDSQDVNDQKLSGVFVQIGLIPNSTFVKGLLKLNSYGEIIIDEFCNTSEDGIFACGDVTTIPYKQIVMSMGEGSKAAITAADYLQKMITPAASDVERGA